MRDVSGSVRTACQAPRVASAGGMEAARKRRPEHGELAAAAAPRSRPRWHSAGCSRCISKLLTIHRFSGNREGDADAPAGSRDQQILGLKITHDGLPACAECAADADLAAPLRDPVAGQAHDAECRDQQKRRAHGRRGSQPAPRSSLYDLARAAVAARLSRAPGCGSSRTASFAPSSSPPPAARVSCATM